MSNFLWPRGVQNARLLCAPLSPRVCWNSHSSSRWCHPIISSSAAPFSSCLQFTERTDVEAEAPILWPYDVESQLIGKDADAVIYVYVYICVCVYIYICIILLYIHMYNPYIYIFFFRFFPLRIITRYWI